VASTRRGRLGRALCIPLLVTAVIAPNSALAAAPTPAPTVASLTAKLDQLATQTKTLTDRYNAAQSQVRAVEMQADVQVQAAEQAQKVYRAERASLTRLMAVEYERGTPSAMSALVDSPDQQRYLETVQTLRMVSERRAEVVAQVAAARDRAMQARDKTNEFLDDASRRRNDLAHQRTKILAETAMFARIRGTLTLAAQPVVGQPPVSTSSAIINWATTCVQQAESDVANGDCGGLASYVNPIKPGEWTPERTDQGVDWGTNVARPVVAIGDGVITYSKLSGTGWPGAFLCYGLTTGNHAGLYIYVAENITDLLPVGTPVKAGQQIATAIPGGSETEWGYAAAPGWSSEPATPYNGAPDGTQTSGGKAFARFLIELGAQPLQPPGPGPDRP
jgi:murein DD-endopeptidase MepM/ murein hydrolase activator NlpD